MATSHLEPFLSNSLSISHSFGNGRSEVSPLVQYFHLYPRHYIQEWYDKFTTGIVDENCVAAVEKPRIGFGVAREACETCYNIPCLVWLSYPSVSSGRTERTEG